MPELTRNQISLIKSLYTRHGRKKSELCVVDGVKCCTELLEKRSDLLELLISNHQSADKFKQYSPIVVDNTLLSQLSATVANQGVIAIARRPAEIAHDHLPPDPFILVLDRIADPGNMGTILRTALAVGLKEVWLTAGTVDPFNDKTVRSAMSAQFVLGLRHFDSLSDLKQLLIKFGFSTIFRTDPHAGCSCFSKENLYDRSAIIIGSEADGAAELDGAESVTIPMPGNSESLNAAQAATVFLFEYVRRNLSTLK